MIEISKNWLKWTVYHSEFFFFILSKTISSCVVDCGVLFENDGELKLKSREIYVDKK